IFINRAYFCERAAESTGLTPAAITLTRISFSFGSGNGTSSYFNTSGPPYSCATTAFIVFGKSATESELEMIEAKKTKTNLRLPPRDADRSNVTPLIRERPSQPLENQSW